MPLNKETKPNQTCNIKAQAGRNNITYESGGKAPFPEF